jgi:hypothetical protein
MGQSRAIFPVKRFLAAVGDGLQLEADCAGENVVFDEVFEARRSRVQPCAGI